ncbi:MAG: hypothetical protein WA160_03280 [Pseudobdellovibrio sp.]
MSDASATKTMLILKSTATSIASAEAFLKNRDWEIFSTSDIKEAITYAMEKKPDYLLIGVDHSNTKIAMVPKILKQSSEITVIAYTEKHGLSSAQILNDFLADYRVTPPTTGPAIERCVNKHLRDLQKKTEQKHEPTISSSNNSSSNDIISVRGGNKSNSVSKFSQSADANENIEQSGNSSGISYSPTHYNQADPSSSSINFNASENLANNPNPEAPAETDSESFAGWTPVPINNSELKNKAKNKKGRNPDSLIAVCTEQSLTEVAQDNTLPEEVINALANSNAACMIIESPRFSGYLIAMLNNNFHPSEEFIQNFQKKLYLFLTEKGERVSENKSLEVKIKDVEFSQWAEHSADFLKTTIHKNDEIAIAFFPREKPQVQLEKSEIADMDVIRIDDLAGDRIVQFDVFIYLKTNNKVLLCTAKGKVFCGKQRMRFIQQGMTHLHVQKVDAEIIAKYYAENYLNDLVDNFIEKKIPA